MAQIQGGQAVKHPMQCAKCFRVCRLSDSGKTWVCTICKHREKANGSQAVSDTPSTDDQKCDMFVGVSTFTPSDIQQAFDFARQLERELNAANERIQSLIEERDRANRLADWKWNLRDEFQLLLGTDKIEEGIEAVKELKRRIKRLEQAGDAMADVLVWSSGTQYKRSPTASEWRKVKEAKP